MRFKVCSIITGSFFMLMLLTGCNSKDSMASGVWNEESSTFSIESENISYTLPTDISLWAIAHKESMPPEMEFFGIDTSEEVCVGIFRPDSPLNGIRSSAGYSNEEINNIVREISSPQQGQKIINEKMESKLITNPSDRTWYFFLAREIVNQSMSRDTFAINYSGYIFDGNTHPFGLVVISPSNLNDSIKGRELFQKYASGLNIKIVTDTVKTPMRK